MLRITGSNRTNLSSYSKGFIIQTYQALDLIGKEFYFL